MRYHFNSDNYHLLNNITLPLNCSTTQVDHILVSKHGIFVIETKHYSGWIFGDEKSKNWTQVIYKVKIRFQNPLRQNYKHVVAVKQLLDFLPKNVIHNVVVFTGSAVFKTNKPKNVFNHKELIEFIESQKEELISLNRVAFSVGRIECARFQISKETDIEHIANLKS